jgi:transglutaminase-like putative cysteine protease
MCYNEYDYEYNMNKKGVDDVKKRIICIVTSLIILISLIFGGCETSLPPENFPPDIPQDSPVDTTTTPNGITTDITPADTELIVTDATPGITTTPVSDTLETPETPENPVVTDNPDITDIITLPNTPESTPEPATPATGEVPTTPIDTAPVTITTTTITTITDLSVPASATPRPPSPPSPPTIVLPVNSGTNVSETAKSTIDYSNISDGYVMIRYTGSNSRLVLQITAPNDTMYQYSPNPDNTWKSFPLSEGNGKYIVALFEGTTGTTAVTALDKVEFNARITNANMPFLMPNYYVNFASNSAVVTKASELCGGMTEVEKVAAIYNWVIENIEYDYAKAASNLTGTYVPDLAQLMKDKKGICFDFAAGMAAMLRSQGIPARLEVGWAGDEYHAWISVHTKEAGWVNGWIRFNGSQWVLMEPTWAAVNGDSRQGFRDFVNQRSNYTTLFLY